MQAVLLLLCGLAATTVLVLALVVWTRKGKPRAWFESGQDLTVRFRGCTVHCHYWVEWGVDRWHIRIDRIEENSHTYPTCVQLASKAVAYALRGGKGRILVIDGRETVPDYAWPPG